MSQGYETRRRRDRKPIICFACSGRTLSIKTDIPWRDTFNSILPNKDAEDAKGETIAGELAETHRAHETRHSTKLRKYEEQRRKVIADYKPEWVKRGRNTAELTDIMKG